VKESATRQRKEVGRRAIHIHNGALGLVVVVYFEAEVTICHWLFLIVEYYEDWSQVSEAD
jgi:fucose permease